jgi:hypothetical protein
VSDNRDVTVRWPYREPPDVAYDNDADFHQLVDVLEMFIHKRQFSPAELRAAAVFAACRYEMKNAKAYVFVRDEKALGLEV